MLDCSRCGNALDLTSPACACGEDAQPALDGVGLVCPACEAWTAAGSGVCAACGAAFERAEAPEVTPAATETGLDPGADAEPGTELDFEVPRWTEAEIENATQTSTSTSTQTSTSTSTSTSTPAAPPDPADPPVLQRTGRGSRGAPIVHAFPAGHAGAPPRVQLTAKRDDGSIASVVLGDLPVLCGRTEGELLVPGETVSRRHARFSLTGGHPYVEDLGSLNGTWLRVRAPRRLSFGDELRLESRRLRFAWTPGGAALEEIRDDGGSAATHPLRAGATVLGRAGDVAFPEDLELARHHARVELTTSGAGVADLGSVAGTWIRVRVPEPLSAGDELLLGAERLRVEPA